MAEREVSRREFVRESALAAAAVAAGLSARAAEPDKSRILSYNENMEYRRLGKTGWMVSAVCLGGHWKRVQTMVPDCNCDGWTGDVNHPGFQKNRYEVVSRCIERGINYIDACSPFEVRAYAKALEGRRDKMYLGFSWCDKELRNAQFRTATALLQALDEGLREAKLDYVDLWRVTMDQDSHNHPRSVVEEMIQALETAKKQGKARAIGLSSHDRVHIKWMVETFPQLEAVVTPYHARSMELPKDSLFEAVRKQDVGVFGIKPFASNSLFRGDSTLASPHAEADDRLAREAIRYVLANPAVTAPIPGLINTHQVDNVAEAVRERRRLDRAEAQELDKAMERAWANLPPEYQFLKNWERV
jgi:aryl-alcohol dehydrogenase-like predicted oxidoreductase